MIKVLLLASLRDATGIAEITVDYDPSLKTVADVVNAAQQRQAELQSVMQTTGKLMLALNQEICRDDATIADGDEVALLPPVTGG